MSYRIRFSHVATASFMALVLAALFTTQAAPAVLPDATVKIGLIDTEKVMGSSIVGKTALAGLKQQQAKAESQIQSQQQEIKDLQDKINTGRLSLAQDQLAQLSKQLDSKMMALRRSQDDATRDLNKKRDDILADIDQKIMPVINQIGKEKGYTVIFRKFESGLIYADDSADITALVIQRLDAGK
jgi:outer membrane protein